MDQPQAVVGLQQGQAAGEHGDEGEDGRQVIAPGGDLFHHRVQHPPQPHQQQPGEGQFGGEDKQPMRHRGPGEAQQSLLDEFHMGGGEQQQHEQAQVEHIAGEEVKGRPLAEAGRGPGTGDKRTQRPFERTPPGWGQIGLDAAPEDVHQAPDHANHEHCAGEIPQGAFDEFKHQSHSPAGAGAARDGPLQLDGSKPEICRCRRGRIAAKPKSVQPFSWTSTSSCRLISSRALGSTPTMPICSISRYQRSWCSLAQLAST